MTISRTLQYRTISRALQCRMRAKSLCIDFVVACLSASARLFVHLEVISVDFSACMDGPVSSGAAICSNGAQFRFFWSVSAGATVGG